MYHEATACHVGGDLMELLGIVHDTLRAVRLVKESKDVALNMSLGIKDLPEALRRLATLLNTYNPAELRQIAISKILHGRYDSVLMLRLQVFCKKRCCCSRQKACSFLCLC